MEHHAYVYEGSQELLADLAQSARELFNFNAGHPASPKTSSRGGDPDVRVEAFEKFGIEDAESLKSSTVFKTVSGRALYILGLGSITTEAQQALLKLFEEPQKGVIFVLLVPHGSLIATLRSRTLPYPRKIEGDKKSSAAVKKFLSEPPKLRGLAVAALLKDDEGVRERARDFVNGLEGELYGRLAKSGGKKEIRQGLEDIAKVRSYLSDRSPSLKMLLEHLAAALPKL